MCLNPRPVLFTLCSTHCPTRTAEVYVVLIEITLLLTSGAVASILNIGTGLLLPTHIAVLNQFIEKLGIPGSPRPTLHEN